jgi:hydrogenase nickel incorporation protein HypB
VAAGDDKVAQLPHRVATADLILLNKADLLPHVEFDLEAFRADARRINPAIRVIEVSAAQGAGLDEWEKWLRDAIRQHRPRNGRDSRPSESFIG